MDEKAYWVAFSMVKGVGSVRMQSLLKGFGDAKTAWEAPVAALEEAGLSPKIANATVKLRERISLEQVWERIQKLGIKVLTWEDENYPKRLLEVENPPPVLYCAGTLQEEDSWAVAVVGTRRMTSYGKQVTAEIVHTLAGSGVTIVSGMARGVDAVAHHAALEAGGRTLAVLGSGVDRIYPPEHRELAKRIFSNGALLSDYAPGTPPDAANFPPRNRIISALSMAVIVIEAGDHSGALITAAFAGEQGREIFAVPGNIYAPQSKGTNRLIQQGAHPLLDVQDVLETLNLAMVSEQREARMILPSNAVEARLYEIIGREPMHVDEIRAQSKLPISEVSSTLALMELKGIVRQVGGMQYVAVHEQGAQYRTGEG